MSVGHTPYVSSSPYNGMVKFLIQWLILTSFECLYPLFIYIVQGFSRGDSVTCRLTRTLCLSVQVSPMGGYMDGKRIEIERKRERETKEK